MATNLKLWDSLWACRAHYWHEQIDLDGFKASPSDTVEESQSHVRVEEAPPPLACGTWLVSIQDSGLHVGFQLLELPIHVALVIVPCGRHKRAADVRLIP